MTGERDFSEYEYLRGDPRAALEQIWGEIHSALDMDVFTTATSDGRLAHTLLEGLKGKAELGLTTPVGGNALNADDTTLNKEELA